MYCETPVEVYFREMYLPDENCFTGCWKAKTHTQIPIYVYEKPVSAQFCPTDDTLPWSYDSSHLKAVEHIYHGNAEIPSAITKRDIFNVLEHWWIG